MSSSAISSELAETSGTQGLSETPVRDGSSSALIAEMCQGLALLLQILLLSRGACSQEECPQKIVNTCDDCIRAGPFCMWCKHVNFTKTGEPNAVRCDTEARLLEKGCDSGHIISPSSYVIRVRSKPLSKGTPTEEPIQIRPQEVQLVLRPGKPQKFMFKFKRAADYPVDLYYLMDLSYSMKDDLENVKNLGEDLLKTLGNITSQARIGFGAFVDKTVLPYTNTNPAKLNKPCPEDEMFCQPAFGYRHVLSMTENKDLFKEKVSSQKISGNLDTPEGSLDAMMQAAVCGDKIGWRNSTRLLVLTTDAGFHMAGDGKLGSILFPNDCKCHLGEDMMYGKSNKLDYPSVGQLARKLAENNIQPIFAVTDNVEPIYKKLKDIIPKSEVAVLSKNSINIVTLIESAYKNLSSNVIVTHDELPEHITVTYTSNCMDGGQPGTKATCDNVGINQEVEFNVTVMAAECMDSVSFHIVALGFQEKMKVTVTTQCTCECDEALIEKHEHCSNQGNITCGICSCNDGFVGQRCECSGKNPSSLRAQCHHNGIECSGLGECVCGVCQCYTSDHHRTIHGAHCECDDQNCDMYQNKLCGGNGKCDCGTCKCNPDYEGRACQCKNSTEGCKKGNADVCSGRGTCVCNRCECVGEYKSPFCEECPSCTTPCLDAVSCIECLGFGTGAFSKNCSGLCTHIRHDTTASALTKGEAQGSAELFCKERDTHNCWMTYTMKQLDGLNKYSALIQSERECPVPLNIATIIIGTFAGVALIGMILIGIVKGVIYMSDLKEFKIFQQARQKEQWALDSVLFKKATTTVQNPLYSGD
ncbi:hypothetical protein AAFF_G00325610 [Aldrovandia affinis]|uniref:Integrin beta n=1 Tax=Aldrovandia affinis TaxID=143900 RepID=A0AAD7X1G8_9TELE|nr:hypothetical protein AAFF_G00325610 [Aldrovandia affinis]